MAVSTLAIISKTKRVGKASTLGRMEKSMMADGSKASNMEEVNLQIKKEKLEWVFGRTESVLSGLQLMVQLMQVIKMARQVSTILLNNLIISDCDHSD